MRVLISLTAIAGSLILSIGSYVLLVYNRPRVEARPVEEPSFNVDVFRAEALSFREMLSAFGTAEADREVVLAAQVTGEIIELSPQTRVGRRVSAEDVRTRPDAPSRRVEPDVLMRIDPRDYQERVEQAESTILSSQTEIAQLRQQRSNLERQLELGRSDLDSLKTEYERIRDLRERGAGSASQLTQSLLEMRRYEDTIIQLENQLALIPHQLAAAEQKLATATSEKQRAENDLQRTTVTPPFDGVIGDVEVEQGQYVRAGEPLLRLIDPERIEVPVALGLDDYLLLEDSVRSGQYPLARLAENESSPPRWTGRVVRVAPDADAASRTIRVYIEVRNSEQDQPLLPGTFVFGWIAGPVFEDAIVIPRSALVENHVFVVDADDRAEKRSVRTGRRLRSLIVIEDGLRDGDRIVLTNLDIVRNGTLLQPRETITVQDELDRQRVSAIRPLDTAAKEREAVQ